MEVAKLLFVQFVHGGIEFLENLQPGGSNAGFDHPAVLGLPLARDEGALFHAIQEPGHVGIAGDHAVPDAFAGEAIGAGTAEDAEDVVLGAGEAVGFDQEIGILCQAVSGAQQSDEDLGFEAGGNGFVGFVSHGSNVVVITTIVKRKM